MPRTIIQGEVETSHAVFFFEVDGVGDISGYQPEVDVLVIFGESHLVARKRVEGSTRIVDEQSHIGFMEAYGCAFELGVGVAGLVGDGERCV